MQMQGAAALKHLLLLLLLLLLVVMVGMQCAEAAWRSHAGSLLHAWAWQRDGGGCSVRFLGQLRLC
jgi:hypothetical protein